jgi:hypothetical protein
MTLLSPLAMILSFVVFLLWIFARMTTTKGRSSEPPMVPYYIPYLGNILAFALYPKTFIEDNNKKVFFFSLSILQVSLIFIQVWECIHMQNPGIQCCFPSWPRYSELKP